MPSADVLEGRDLMMQRRQRHSTDVAINVLTGRGTPEQVRDWSGILNEYQSVTKGGYNIPGDPTKEAERSWVLNAAGYRFGSQGLHRINEALGILRDAHAKIDRQLGYRR